MSAALSPAGRLCANIGQTLRWLLLVRVSQVVEGASLLPSLRFVEPRATLWMMSVLRFLYGYCGSPLAVQHETALEHVIRPFSDIADHSS